MYGLERFRDAGDLYLPTSLKTFLDTYIIGSDESQFYLNYWSLVHFVTGILITYFLLKRGLSGIWLFLAALVIHTLWELLQYLVENTPRTRRGLNDFFIDTVMFLIGVSMMVYTHKHIHMESSGSR